jgi:DNA-directed RNA polymerase subunit RPC12/RpoP
VNAGLFEYDDEVECPHCGAKLGFIDDIGVEIVQDEDNQIACDDCGESLVIRVVTIEFTVTAGEKA